MTITASLVTSRTSGPAPLAVHFDATGTTMDNASGFGPFHELVYYFDFDDPGAGTWKYSGRSKNRKVGGPVAAHVYETPGTYTPRLMVRDVDGNVAVITGDEITVSDPDTVYSGTDTICVSQDSNFTGAPAGASQVTSIPTQLTDGVDKDWANKRVLLRGGEAFDATIQIEHGMTDIHIGSFGGGKVTITNFDCTMTGAQLGDGTGTPANGYANQVWPSRLVVSDIIATAWSLPPHTQDILLLRCEGQSAGVSGYSNHVSITLGGVLRDYLDFPINKFNFLVDCEFEGTGITESDTANVVYLEWERSVMMGCLVNTSYSHSCRFPFNWKNVYEHNRLPGNMNATLRRLLIKAHSQGDDEYDGLDGRAGCLSRYNCFEWNLCGSETGNYGYGVAYAPTDFASEALKQSLGVPEYRWTEVCDDAVMYNNHFITGTTGGSTRHIDCFGRRITARGNTIKTGTLTIQSDSYGSETRFAPYDGPYDLDNDPSPEAALSCVTMGT